MASMTLPIRAIALFALAAAAPLCAQDSRKTSIDGRCQYPEKVVKNRNETVLILCDMVEIDQGSARATLDFAQRSCGSMARFTGSMSSDTMAISQVTLRDGRRLSATGTCRMHRRKDGELAVISCLAKAGARTFAANFVPSRV
ncbi:hypothetical protein [Blastomonas fulva]|uniref:hypothetical protein n=1 Tax=Blastomonas fulva TaxID=1550728 RepID=UPI003F7170E6